MSIDTSGAQHAEAKPAFTAAEAAVEAHRCLYCFDAPCMHACPTHIDIAGFIRKIATGNVRGSALTILDSNLLGRTCSRVCPVEELCEGACVHNETDKPIEIGRLQRYATDWLAEREPVPYQPESPTGRKVLVVGSGPAGLSAAGELAKLGHDVTVWEKRELAGGLSTYGIIPLREPVQVSLDEVEMVRGLGVTIETGRELSSETELDDACRDFDAVFLATGLGAVPPAGFPGQEHVLDGLEYIATGKLSPQTLPPARTVVVIGAGNTAIDAATVARRSGAEVTIVYRRTAAEMTAYEHEYSFACAEGIEFRFLTQPVELVHEHGRVSGLRCQRTALGAPDASGRRRPEPVPGTEFLLEADLVVAAIGQQRYDQDSSFGLGLTGGYLSTGDGLATTRPGVWAGGDAVRAQGDASTVMAVQDGKKAAASIHAYLTERAKGE